MTFLTRRTIALQTPKTMARGNWREGEGEGEGDGREAGVSDVDLVSCVCVARNDKTLLEKSVGESKQGLACSVDVFFFFLN